MADDDAEMERAATKMQAIQRGRNSRKDVLASPPKKKGGLFSRKVAPTEEEQEMERAATKLQAMHRGRLSRKEVAPRRRGFFGFGKQTEAEAKAADDAARLAAYRQLANQRAGEAREAAEIRKQRRLKQTAKLPPGVWWGFHYFWPKEVLEGTQKDKDPLDDPKFIEDVVRLMSDEKVIAAFARVDRSGTGRIDNKDELEWLAKMCLPNPQPLAVTDFLRGLDIDGDGEIDLWEFCVHLQKCAMGTSRADMEAEVDAAFELFSPDGNNQVDLAEICRVMQMPNSGQELSEKEIRLLIADLGSGVAETLNAGGKVDLSALRGHPCYM
jgi:Ca2+-binding EF-hand superfamily protein